PSTLESTNLFLPLSLCWLLAMRPVLSRPDHAARTMKWALTAGVVSALLVLCQPLSLLPVAGAWLLTLRRNKTAAFLLLACLTIVIAPWTIRNRIVFNAFIPFKSPVWMNVVSGFEVRSHGMTDKEFIDAETRRILDSVQTTGTDVEREHAYREHSLRIIRRDPAAYLEKCLVQAARYWTFPPSYDGTWMHPPFMVGRLLPVLFLGAMLLLSFRYLRAYTDVLVPMILTLAVFTVVYALTHVSNIRFKLDVGWLQCIAAGIVLHHLLPERTRNPSEQASSRVRPRSDTGKRR
ncbi:MAG: hypothetical protein ACKO9V_01030, partial [Candidatus Kapaibacterium sp.]